MTMFSMNFNSGERIGIHVLAEYCRLVNTNSTGSEHQLERLSENLILFAEVCPVIYFGNVKQQLKNLAGYFRKRILEKHYFLVSSVKTSKQWTCPSFLNKKLSCKKEFSLVFSTFYCKRKERQFQGSFFFLRSSWIYLYFGGQ